jgi:hypothetical protein
MLHWIELNQQIKSVGLYRHQLAPLDWKSLVEKEAHLQQLSLIIFIVGFINLIGLVLYFNPEAFFSNPNQYGSRFFLKS